MMGSLCLKLPLFNCFYNNTVVDRDKYFEIALTVFSVKRRNAINVALPQTNILFSNSVKVNPRVEFL